MIYFVAAQGCGEVKIGYAANVESRVAELQCANPNRLDLIATAPGDYKEELAWHRRFDRLRGQGEWFCWERELFDAVAQEVGFRLNDLDRRFVGLGYWTEQEAAAATHRRHERAVVEL